MGNWLNKDGLYIQFGTDKAVAETAGEYLTYGDFREIEVLIDLTTLTSSAVVQSNTTFFPSGNATLFVEEVQVETLVAATGGTSFSVGLVNSADRTTALSTTAFVNALVLASTATAGQRVTLTNGVTSAGGYIGTPNITAVGNITALASGTYTAGKVLVRIKYRIWTNITQ